jgi:rhodanese-related sulfurtransferase
MPQTITTDDLRTLIEEQRPQLVEVLPRVDFDIEHLPGAVCVPLTEMNERAVEDLDRKRPLVTYCFDYQCDLSARAASLMASLGFTDVYDYTASKVAWFAAGLPAEGSKPDSSRAGVICRPVPTAGPDELVGELAARFEDSNVVAVVTAGDVVLGLVRSEVLGLPPDTPVARAMQPGPVSVRPSITAAELADSMAKDHRDQVLVTTLDGHLLGIVWRDDLHGLH